MTDAVEWAAAEAAAHRRPPQVVHVLTAPRSVDPGATGLVIAQVAAERAKAEKLVAQATVPALSVASHLPVSARLVEPGGAAFRDPGRSPTRSPAHGRARDRLHPSNRPRSTGDFPDLEVRTQVVSCDLAMALAQASAGAALLVLGSAGADGSSPVRSPSCAPRDHPSIRTARTISDVS